jgi:hypothetical protein
VRRSAGLWVGKVYTGHGKNRKLIAWYGFANDSWELEAVED